MACFLFMCCCCCFHGRQLLAGHFDSTCEGGVSWRSLNGLFQGVGAVLLRHCAGAGDGLFVVCVLLLLLPWPPAACWSLLQYSCCTALLQLGLLQECSPLGCGLSCDLAQWLTSVRFGGHLKGEWCVYIVAPFASCVHSSCALALLLDCWSRGACFSPSKSALPHVHFARVCIDCCVLVDCCVQL